MLTESLKTRAIAFYLPQYHPIAENDEWWGKGFTEWRNVTKAKPLFPGHYQPHLPADLGFYDLRLPEVRQAQAELAIKYGIYGFCYYHYWFNGRRILERPFDEVLTSGKPDFPFCLCWANESWTRRWDGSDREVLMEQIYDEKDDRCHMKWLANAFHDPRYIRIDDKPLFLVYRASKLPSPLKTAAIWRKEAYEQGIGEIFLCAVESFASEHKNPNSIGFDATVEFQPDWSQLESPLKRGRLWNLARKFGISERAFIENNIYEYTSIVDGMLTKPEVKYKRFPCVTPSWDNTSRRQNGEATIFKNASPDLYERWLSAIIQREISDETSHQIVFINAWNEWAEGNHLEPCQKWGNAYLEATQRALMTNNKIDKYVDEVV